MLDIHVGAPHAHPLLDLREREGGDLLDGDIIMRMEMLKQQYKLAQEALHRLDEKKMRRLSHSPR
jgi:hypothetical protein